MVRAVFCCVLLVLCGSAVNASDASGPTTGPSEVPLACGSIDGLTPGDSFFYRMVVDDQLAAPYSGHPFAGFTTQYARVVVTDVLKAGEGVRVKARIDVTDKNAEVTEHGKDVYRLLLAHKGDRVDAAINANMPLPSHPMRATLAMSNGIPCPLLGYPSIAGVPREGAAPTTVKGRTLGAIAVRYVPSFDAKDGVGKVTVEYFRKAREDDREKGRQILYLDPDRAGSCLPRRGVRGPCRPRWPSCRLCPRAS